MDSVQQVILYRPCKWTGFV